jgi:glycosyltransferase involved in cell wall biosynthesis
MKIIVNAISAKTGGIMTYTKNLMRSLAKRSVDVVFALPSETNLEADVPVIHMPADRMGPVPRLLWEQTMWRRTVSSHKPDILFSSANFGLLAPPVPQVLLVREGGLFDPYYLTNVAPSLYTKPIFHRIARRKLIVASAQASDVVMTPTQTMKDLLVSWAGGLEGRVEKNQYGTLSDVFTPEGEQRGWNQDGVLKLLFVSAYYPHKQPGLVSEAVKLLNEAGFSCHLSVTMEMEQIAGTRGGAQDHFLLGKGIERGQVSMLGYVPYDQLPDLYKENDLFVFPSLSETFGHPLAEAMSIGMPIMASDTPVHREVCQDAAEYFSPLLPSDLAQQIRELDANPSRRQQMGELGQTYVKSNFSWEDHVDRLLDIFERVIAARRR